MGTGSNPTYFVAEHPDRKTSEQLAIDKCEAKTNQCEVIGCTQGDRVIFQERCVKPTSWN